MSHHTNPRRHDRENILWHKLYQYFLRLVSQGNRNKNKNKQEFPGDQWLSIHHCHCCGWCSIPGLGMSTCQGCGQKETNKNKQMGPNQTYELFQSKGKHKQNEKTSYRMRENICKWCDWLGLNFQNIPTAHTTQQQRKQTTQPKKWADYLNRHFFKDI